MPWLTGPITEPQLVDRSRRELATELEISSYLSHIFYHLYPMNLPESI